MSARSRKKPFSLISGASTGPKNLVCTPTMRHIERVLTEQGPLTAHELSAHMGVPYKCLYGGIKPIRRLLDMKRIRICIFERQEGHGGPPIPTYEIGSKPSVKPPPALKPPPKRLRMSQSLFSQLVSASATPLRPLPPPVWKGPDNSKGPEARQHRADKKYRDLLKNKRMSTPDIAKALGFTLTGTISSLIRLEERKKVRREGRRTRAEQPFGRLAVCWVWCGD